LHRIVTFCLEDKCNVNKMYSQKVIFRNSLFIILYSLSDLEATRDELLFEVHKMSQQEEGPKPDKTVSYRIYKNCFCICCKDECVFCKLWNRAFFSISFEAHIEIILN